MNTAIPKGLLKHTCLLTRYRSEGIFGERVPVEQVRLRNVRISVSSERRADRAGEVIKHRAVLYYDCMNSVPADAVFCTEDTETEIRYRGRDYRIIGIKYVSTGGRTDHIRLELGGIE